MNTTSQGTQSSSSSLLDNAIAAIHDRGFFAFYPEHPKAYAEDLDKTAKDNFAKLLNQDYSELLQKNASTYIGEEVSPFLQTGLGIRYPQFNTDILINNSKTASKSWNDLTVEKRADILLETLENIKGRFFDIAYATMHTTGQSFMMSFQASGPHANDRALEAIALGVEEMRRFPEEKTWIKPMGKFELKIEKKWKTVPRGLGLVIGCATFPVWNTVPGLYADLITGNTAIVKPHPKAILPIAIVIAEIQKVLSAHNLDTNIVQLAVDTVKDPITKQLAEHKEIKLIDFTGSTSFGNYIESLDKVCFTEKAGVNSVIIDSVKDMKQVAQNLAFSASLYSGQMCTAPQNIFIPSSGIKTAEGTISYEDIVSTITQSFKELCENPKAGPGTLGGIQSDATVKRVADSSSAGKVALASSSIKNEEFENARICTPVILEYKSSDRNSYMQESFGPIVNIIQTSGTEESVKLAAETANEHGSITCLAFSTDPSKMELIESEMNNAFTPVTYPYKSSYYIFRIGKTCIS